MSAIQVSKKKLSVLRDALNGALVPSGTTASAKGRRRGRRGGQAVLPNVPLAYRMNAPAKIQSLVSGSGGITVSHREYVGPVKGSYEFTVRPYSINPGKYDVLPWLSAIAQNFETYSFRKLRFVYEPFVGASSPGAVSLTVDYDAADVPPTSKLEFMNFHRSVTGNVWSPVAYVCDAQDLHKQKEFFVRCGLLRPNLDIKMYDVGNLLVAVCACADAVTDIGDLYIEYTIDLMTPQINNEAQAYNNSAKYTNFSPTVSEDVPFGDMGSGEVLGGLPISASGSSLLINKAGTYLLDLVWNGVDTTAVGPTITGHNESTVLPSPLESFTNATHTSSTAQYILNAKTDSSPFEFDFTSGGILTHLTSVALLRLMTYEKSLV
jgi:hypothetical protein